VVKAVVRVVGTYTVNAALEFVAGRRRGFERLLDDPYALGVGPDISDPGVMRTARR
jgi:hypothetical protein